MTEVAKNVCGTKNVAEVTKNVTEVAKSVCGINSMAVYGRVWSCSHVWHYHLEHCGLISPYITLYCLIFHSRLFSLLALFIPSALFIPPALITPIIFHSQPFHTHLFSIPNLFTLFGNLKRLLLCKKADLMSMALEK